MAGNRRFRAPTRTKVGTLNTKWAPRTSNTLSEVPTTCPSPRSITAPEPFEPPRGGFRGEWALSRGLPHPANACQARKPTTERPLTPNEWAPLLLVRFPHCYSSGVSRTAGVKSTHRPPSRWNHRKWLTLRTGITRAGGTTPSSSHLPAGPTRANGVPDAAHSSARDPRSCVLPWPRWWVSRVELVRARRAAKRP